MRRQSVSLAVPGVQHAGQVPVQAGSSPSSSSLPLASPSPALLRLQPASADRRRMMRRCMVLGTAAIAAGMVDEGRGWRRLVADYRTGVGMQRALALGSQVSVLLNTGTAIDVGQDEGRLLIRLLEGELLLRQQGGPGPVLVETTQGRISSHNARLAVRREPRRTVLNVLDGTAAVRPAAGRADAWQVAAGRRSVFDRLQQLASAAVQDDEMAWADGMIVARDMKLADFVGELQRYSEVRLQCDPAVAAWRVSGRFPIADLQRVFAWLPQAMPLRIEQRNDHWGRQALLIRKPG